MRVTGFTFVRNAIKYDYPVVESIRSILPLCDDFVVAVGKSEDQTLPMIQAIDPQKIKILETIWDDSLRVGGKVLAIETDKAFRAVPASSDWAFYIQADEVIHEKYWDNIYKAMQKYKDHKHIDGLLLRYLHFYGAYKYVGESLRWYRREVRIIKTNKNIYSYRDAQGFRKDANKKLDVKLIDASMYHYGWVKKPTLQQRKYENFWRYFHHEPWGRNIKKASQFDYNAIDALRLFNGTHPKVMQTKVANQDWSFEYDVQSNKFSFKEKVKRFIQDLTGYQIGEYKNYNLV